jgi:hypothetical protein
MKWRFLNRKVEEIKEWRLFGEEIIKNLKKEEAELVKELKRVINK